MVGFRAYADAFLLELADPRFGASLSEKRGRQPESAGTTTKVRESVATRKLRTSGLYDVLKQKPFLRSVYALVKERYRLDSEQDQVRRVGKEMRAVIRQVKNGQKTIQSLRKAIKELEARLTPILGSDSLRSLQRARSNLMKCQRHLLEVEEDSGSEIHSAESEGYKKSQWEVLIREFNYDLDTLKQKAPDQWLVRKLDVALEELFSQAETHVPEMTRYRVIAALCRAGGNKMIEPSAIKQFFLQMAAR
jgi:chromosome segregation ATPase